jgi:hypothetical protein
MTTVHGAITNSAKPLVGRSRRISITEAFTNRSWSITELAKVQLERSRSAHGIRSQQPFTFPTAPLGAGERTGRKDKRAHELEFRATGQALMTLPFWSSASCCVRSGCIWPTLRRCWPTPHGWKELIWFTSPPSRPGSVWAGCRELWSYSASRMTTASRPSVSGPGTSPSGGRLTAPVWASAW